MAETSILSVSLKQYKKDIDDLKGSLLGLEKGSKEYSSILDEVREKETKLKEVMADVKQTADVSENSMNALKQQLKEMKQEAGNLDIGSDRFKELTQSIAETTETLKNLEAEQGTYSRNVGNYESGVVSLKTQLKEMKAEMAQMLANGIQPTDAAFVELAKKAGDLTDAMKDSQAVISHFANDTKGLATVVDLAKTGTAAYGAFKGTLSLFGIENENVNKSLQTMVTITTTLNSLQTLQTALVDRASITYRAYHGVVALCSSAMAALGLSKTETTAATVAESAATEAHAAAMGEDAVATGAATVATNLFQKALIATGIGAIVVAIGLLIANFDKLTKLFPGLNAAIKYMGELWDKVIEVVTGVSKAEREAIEAEEKHKKALEDLSKSLKKTADDAKVSTAIQKQGMLDALNTFREARDEYTRTQAFNDAKKVFEDLGISCNSVADAQLLTTKYMPTVTKMIELQGDIAALTAVKNETYAQSLKLFFELYKEVGMSESDAIQNAMRRAREETSAYSGQIKNLQGQLNSLAQSLPRVSSGGGGGRSSTPTRSTPTRTTRTSGGGDTKKEVDVSGKMDELDKLLDREIKTIEYAYDELEAKGEATLKDQIDKVTKVYQKTKEILNNEIIDREAQLKKVGITAEQKKEIDEDLYEIRQKLLENERNYTIESEKIIVKVREESLKSINEATKKSIEEENKLYKDSGLISHYVDLLKDTQPEVAAAIVKTLSVDDDTKNQIIESLDIVNGESADKRREWYLQEEEDAHQHQIRLIEINKESLVQMGLELGEDSDAYLNLRKEIWKQEEDEAQRHADNLLKIEKQHAKETTKTNKGNIKSWISLGKGVGDVMDDVADFMKDDIDRQVEQGKITEEEAKKRFEIVKAFQISAATIDMLAGAVGGFMGAMQDKSIFPSYLRPILGGLYAASALASGAAQIASIKSTQFGGSSSGGGSGSVGRSATAIDFTGVNVNPILDENADINRLSTLTTTTGGDNRVYILQSDITDSNEQVQIRQNETTF